MICMIQMRRCCHNTQYCLLTKYGRKYRYTDIDLLSISKCYPKMSILWDSLFCNVQICQNLNTGNQWSVNIFLYLNIFRYHTINTHPHICLLLKWFNMNITGFRFNCTLDQTIKKLNDRCFIWIIQIFNFQLIYICC